MNFFKWFTKKEPAVMIPGPQIVLGNTTYTVAPMNFATLKKVTPLLASFQKLSGQPAEQDLDNMIEVIWLALLRNHPNLKRSVVENGLDLANVNAITTQTMSAGGVTPKGEATAASL